MKIKNMLYQSRRDFTALYVCESCGKTEEHEGYDDANFHKNVSPKWACKSCGKASPEGTKTHNPRYGEDVTI